MTSPPEVNVSYDMPVAMRDGTILRANVFRPSMAGRFPVLLTRTPYNKNDIAKWSWSGLDPLSTAAKGFVVVVQDVRGRFASEGVWEPFRSEGADGADTVHWAAKLPFSTGRVAMFSASYCGNNQFLTAFESPPALAAISPAMTWCNPADGLFSRGGAVEWGLALRWSLENGFDDISRRNLGPDEKRRANDALTREWNNVVTDGYWQLPVSDALPITRHRVTDLGIIRAIHEPDHANICDVSGQEGIVAVPTLHTAGWYDIFQQGTLDNFIRATSSGHEARLVVGPWTHLSFTDPIGERCFGMAASRNGFPSFAKGDWSEMQLAWFRRQLGAAPTIVDPQPRVSIFVMGANCWREEEDWPLTRASTQKWFLHGNGTLSMDPSTADQVSEFFYDPANPVPTLGGNGVMTPSYAVGPVDQSSIERRDDVLVFDSSPLEEDLEVIGRVRITLASQSSSISTDWVARLCDVFPDGRSFNLCDGILRVQHNAQTASQRTIDLWSTANVFLKGHRIRVHVTSSSFPRWDRNLNTGNQLGTGMMVAKQRVLHRPESPSFIELPIIR